MNHDQARTFSGGRTGPRAGEAGPDRATTTWPQILDHLARRGADEGLAAILARPGALAEGFVVIGLLRKRGEHELAWRVAVRARQVQVAAAEAEGRTVRERGAALQAFSGARRPEPGPAVAGGTPLRTLHAPARLR